MRALAQRLLGRLNLNWLIVATLVVFILARGAFIFFKVGSYETRSFAFLSVPFTPAESHYSTQEVPR